MSDRMNNLSKIHLFLLYLALSFVAVYLTYSPAILIPFYHHDIYAFGTNGPTFFSFTKFFSNTDWLLDPKVRPFTALLEGFTIKYGSTLQGMSHVRLACVVLISFFSASFSCWLWRAGFSFFSALFLAVMVCCFPGIQTVIIMGASFILVAALVALLAHVIVDQGFLNWHINKSKSLLLMAAGIIVLLLAFFTYPAEAGFFLIPTIVSVLFKPLAEWRITRRVAVRDMLIFLLCCGIYFVAGKVMQVLTSPLDLSGSYTFHMTFHLMERVPPLFKIFPSLWNTDYDFNFQTILVYAIIAFGVVLKLLNRDRGVYPVIYIPQAILSVFALLVLASVAYILQPDFYVFTRILFIFQVMSLFILVWALKVIGEVIFSRQIYAFPIAMFILFFAGSATANYIVAKSALNDNMELNYLATYLSQHFAEKTKISRIHIIGSKNDGDSKFNFNGLKPRDDIFNINTSIYRQDTVHLLDAALLQFTKPDTDILYDCALDDFKLQRMSEAQCMSIAPKNTIVVTYSRLGEKINYTPDMLVINMTSGGLYNKNNLMPANFYTRQP